MTQQSATTLAGLLRRFTAFRELDEDLLQWLAQRSRPFHCTLGQDILLPDRMPEFCFCIVEGRGRLPARRPRTASTNHLGILATG